MSTNAWKLRTIAVAAACALLLSGCGSDNPDDNSGGTSVTASPSAEPAETSSATVSETPIPEPPKQEVSVYVTDEQLTELIERKVTISYGNEADLAAKAVSALQENEGANFSLWHGITVNSVKLDGDVATIDISFPDEARLGAPGELMLIDSLKKTMFQFPFINGIELLVDGEQTESVMGHVELEHPMARE
jgi:hypothetical protein